MDLLGSLLLIKGVKMSCVINSVITIHVLEPNGINLTNEELVCVIFMKYEDYAALRAMPLLILRGQLTKTMNL
jgi:hypothetical protein